MDATAEDIGWTIALNAPRAPSAIAAALREAREYTLGLYEHLTPDQQRFPRIATINPPRWEIGHVGWFQEFWCRRYDIADPTGAATPSRLDEADAFFDSSHVAHATRWDLPLPSWDGIRAYLAATLDDTLASLERPGEREHYFFELALYHEDMHGEALLMTLQALGLPAPSCMRRRCRLPHAHGDVDVAGGAFEMGASPGDAARRFVFDNEKYAHPVSVAPFAISRRCVTQGDFAAFVEDGGYARQEFWNAEARAWLAQTGRRIPAYWRRGAGGEWRIRRFDRWEPLVPEHAVEHVNAFEAEAWCAWAGRRLPDEAEWEKAALDGLLAASGEVWEWTATPFRPYPGFAPDPYADYSQPWFHDHRVLRGGAWATAPRLVHPRFRNFYLPHRHDAFAGFRSCAPGRPR